ncbi:MAG: hypothetical protein AAB336_03750 [Acidobacteriota bacterium]
MMIKDFGARVERVWEGLRPVTKKMLVGALQANLTSPKPKFSYDVHSDWELSELLTALDEQVSDSEVKKNTETYSEIKQLAETIVNVLEAQSESAEVFIQLAERALKQKDYQQIDKITDSLLERFSVGEMCEIVRQTDNPAIRALGFETLALMPTQKLLALIDDPLYDEIIRNVIEQQAFEFENEHARQVLDQIEFIDGMDDD